MTNPRPLNPHAPSYIPIVPLPPVLAPPPPPPPPLPPPFFVDSSPSSTALFPQRPRHYLIYRVPPYTQHFSTPPYEIQTQNPRITTYLPLLPPPPPPPSQLPLSTAESGVVPGAAASTDRRYFERSPKGRGRQINQPRARLPGRRFQRGGSRWRRGGGCRHEKFEKPVLPLNHDEETTTVMIRNIPYDYTRELLLRKLDKFCRRENRKEVLENRTGDHKESNESIIAAYDFFYYPIDFKSKRGRGFAFVNLTHPTTVWKLVNAFHHKKWDYVNGDIWPKVIEIVSAKIQGKEALKKHFAGSSFECETDEFLPVSFTPPRDGSVDDQSVKPTTIGKRRATLYREAKCNH